MKKIFLDTNILLDVLLERHPFCSPAQEIWSLAEKKKVKAGISAISISNIFFIVKKLSSTEKAYHAIQTLMEIFKVLDVNSRTLRKALQLRKPDYEDSIQYLCARQLRADVIISRDAAGFHGVGIPVMDASQYLSLRNRSVINSPD